MSFSRVATGANYPSDVVVGYGLGTIVSAVGTKMFPPIPVPKVKPSSPLHLEVDKRPRRRGRRHRHQPEVGQRHR